MKVRKIVVGIGDVQRWAKDIKRDLKQASSGRQRRSAELLTFESAGALRSFFSARRLAVLRAIREQRPRSIKELAEHLGRDFKNVNTEVHYLARLGLVELGTESGPGAKGRKAPRVVCDELELHIPL
jgi:predicted transcriptional regulator